VFELSFRDERYMPFEGAGAVSQWSLTLPKTFRQFDYQTINDVIVHLSYTALQDDLFREQVEQANAVLEGTIANLLSTRPLARLISLRQDFSTAFNRLLHSPADTAVPVDLTDRFLPPFVRGRALQVARAVLLLRTPPAQTVAGFRLAIDGQEQAGFARDPLLGNLWARDLGGLFAAGLLGARPFAVRGAGDLAPAAVPGDPSALDAAKLLDVGLYVEYRLA
ncbi:MAG TPA: hypothetical protein VFX28_15990, partial [Methylomirabilota bacterium]|nr:hypothetical protein [Methylomirabilota bacterium]